MIFKIIDENVDYTETLHYAIIYTYKKKSIKNVLESFLGLVDKSVPYDEFQIILNELINNKMIFIKGNFFHLTDEYTEWLQNNNEFLENVENFNEIVTKYMEDCEGAKVTSDFVSSALYYQIVKRINDTKKIISKKRFLFLLIISVLLMVIAFILIFVAAYLQDIDANSTLTNAIGFSFFPICLIAVVILIKNSKKLLAYEIDYKKNKFEEGELKHLQITLCKESLERKLSKVLNKLTVENHDFYSNLPGDYYQNITKKEDLKIGNYNKDLHIVFIQNTNNLKESFEDIVDKALLMVSNEHNPQGARIFYGIFFCDDVDIEDITFMKTYLSYALVGEFLVKTPIFFPLLYDRSRNTLIYKSDKIKYVLGSPFNKALSFIEKNIIQ